MPVRTPETKVIREFTSVIYSEQELATNHDLGLLITRTDANLVEENILRMLLAPEQES